ncbi:MAG: NADH:ubiquinone oxidoreductase [Prevotellaceae bacterium]|jgi:Ni,Fe-hydrogenase III small subunit/ferredoxin|nr:NADH:ubiquinone oxidoreductase [Prevotellaceae bacterium]
MFLKELKIFKAHGSQYIRDLTNVDLHALFRGRPEISGGITMEDALELEKLCPAGAITSSPEMALDMGKCLFCKECQFAKPDVIKFTNDYKTAVTRRDDLIIRAGDTGRLPFRHAEVRREVKRLFGRALKLRQVSAGGDNSCEMELNAAGNVNFDMGRFGIEFLASPRHCDGIVVTGPVSQNMAEALQICYDATPSPKIIILAGTDAISGGLFADNEAINRLFINNNTIDLYVPGNPIHPLTFINGILNLISKEPLKKDI